MAFINLFIKVRKCSILTSIVQIVRKMNFLTFPQTFLMCNVSMSGRVPRYTFDFGFNDFSCAEFMIMIR